MSGKLEGFEELAGIELFQQLTIFSGLNYDETMRLFSIARTETHRPGDLIVDQGALGQALYVVRTGTVRVLSVGEGDAVTELGRMGGGELFGEMTLVDEVLTSARVEAVDDVTLFVLPRDAFDELLAQDQALALKVYKAFCRTLSDKLRRLHGLVTAPTGRKNEGE
jgi:CRP/FNR family cyclic AMP-dependent transcriptional regulator